MDAMATRRQRPITEQERKTLSYMLREGMPISSCRQILEQLNVNEQTNWCLYSIMEGRLNDVRFFIDELGISTSSTYVGSNWSTDSSTGWSLLMAAEKYGQSTIANFLRAAGADQRVLHFKVVARASVSETADDIAQERRERNMPVKGHASNSRIVRGWDVCIRE